MIKTVKAFKAKWIGSNCIGLTVYRPDSTVIQLIVNLKDFTVESTEEDTSEVVDSDGVAIEEGANND